MKRRLLFEASAPVDAPLAAVLELVDGEWVADAMLVNTEARAYVDVDHRPGVVGMQGHWWYRGEISAGPDGDRAVLTYRVFNIARRAAWAVPMANRFFIGYRKKVTDSVADLARKVERHLG
ncbi:hypothetical protein [Dactylosporangium darangshiense]|uniref:Polyketide cyclase / dehydrase and lipid transport n=1 Tax=Dactylosporangium darangshiense TaxID=579108 RepID=A0ABP8DLE5_9ACTN